MSLESDVVVLILKRNSETDLKVGSPITYGIGPIYLRSDSDYLNVLGETSRCFPLVYLYIVYTVCNHKYKHPVQH